MKPVPFAARTQWKLSTNRLTQAIEARRAAGLPILDLTESNPTRVGLHYPQELLGPLASSEVLKYEPNPVGMLSARQAVADYYRQCKPSASISPNSIVLTASTSEAYAHAFHLLCNPGDEVLIPQPSYPLLQFLADLQDVTLRPYELVYDHGWQIDYPSLRAAVTSRTRAIVLVHPNNPTGSAVSAREREELNQIATEFGLALVVDEVFLDYAHSESESDFPHSFAGNSAVLTFTLSGLSKICCLPQMKLGWMAISGPPDVAADALARLEVIADTFLSVGTPVQIAAPGMLAQRDEVQQQLRRRVRANLDKLDQVLANIPACSRLEVQAGWYAVLRVPAVGSDEDLAVQILEAIGVLVHPGHFFDFHQDGYLVLSLIPPEAEFAEAVERLEACLKNL